MSGQSSYIQPDTYGPGFVFFVFFAAGIFLAPVYGFAGIEIYAFGNSLFEPNARFSAEGNIAWLVMGMPIMGMVLVNALWPTQFASAICAAGSMALLKRVSLTVCIVMSPILGLLAAYLESVGYFSAGYYHSSGRLSVTGWLLFSGLELAISLTCWALARLLEIPTRSDGS